MASSVDAKLLKSTKFPPEFSTKVDMKKVNVEVMKKWIAGKIVKILGNDDDVVIELCFNLIEGVRFPDIKRMQIQLAGFLDKDTAPFCKELWNLCISAQENPQGVAQELLEAKKLELIQERQAQQSAVSTSERVGTEQQRESEANGNRTRERAERGDRGGRGRGGESWRGGRGDDRRNFDRNGGGRGRDDRREYDRGRGGGNRGDSNRNGFEQAFERGDDRHIGLAFGRRRARDSMTPPRRRDSRDRGAYRAETDTYIPSNREGRGSARRDDRRRSTPPKSDSRSPPPRRRRSPSRSRSRSRSPNPRRRRSTTPDRRSYSGRGGRGRGGSRERRRRRSPSLSDSASSRSRSPTPRRRIRTDSISVSPAPRSRRSKRRDSSSRSRSPSLSRSRSRTRIRRRKSSITDDDIIITTETRSRGRDRDERRLTRSPSRSITPPRRRRPTRSRSASRTGGDRKRRRSVQRYEPSKKRRNSSSIASPGDTRHSKADTGDKVSRISLSPATESSKAAPKVNETRDPRIEASLLKEKLLREKIMKMRKSSTASSSMDDQANAH